MENGFSPRRCHGQRRERRRRYQVRLLACLAASLLLLVAAVRLWPAAHEAPAPAVVVADAAAPVDLREITQTRQARRASPPPPPPPVPLFETDDAIEQEPLDLTVALAPDRAADDAPPGPKSPNDGEAEAPPAAVPGVGARLLRIPELRRPEAARHEDIRARLDVEVVIAPNGRVQDAHVVKRVLLADDTQRTVATLGYGLEEAALDAARRTLFRPARADGKAVESRKTLTLTFEPGD